MSIVSCGSKEIELIAGVQSQFSRDQLKDMHDDAVFPELGLEAYFSKEFFAHAEYIFGGSITAGSNFGETVIGVIRSNLNLKRAVSG